MEIHKHGKWDIHYNTEKDKWIAEKDKVKFTSQSLKSLKTRCTDFEKKKVNVFVIKSYYDGRGEHKETAGKGKANVNKYDDGFDGNVWVIYDKPIQSNSTWGRKVTKELLKRDEVFLDGGENLKAVSEWKKAKEELKEVEKKGYAIIRKVEQEKSELEKPYKEKIRELKKQILPLNWVEKIAEKL